MSEDAFPGELGYWIMIGEKTGETELVFSKLRKRFEALAKQRSSRMGAVLEPMLTLAAGMILLTAVLVFIVPLFSMYERLT
jgi:type II secretory pathway component PulF